MAHLRWLVLMSVVFLVAGCSQERLKELDVLSFARAERAQVVANFCTTEADKVTSRLKFIFVIDKSFSNKAADPQVEGSSPSDPTGDKRYLPIKSFIASNPDPVGPEDDSISFALINFSTDSSIVKGASGETFMSKNEFANVIEEEHHPDGSTTGPIDAGGTNYLAALTNLYKVIDDDVSQAQNEAALTGEAKSSFYVVFFVSDGFPKVAGENQQEVDIVNKILTTKSLEDRQKLYIDAVQLNTAYYYQSAPDAGASSLLQRMSSPSVGTGDFLEFGAGETIDFSQFAVPERHVRHLLKDILVTNTNTLWEEGAFARDSDGDGLSDRLEKQFGSDMNDPDSDDNDVSDGVEHFALGRPCKGATCRPSEQEVFPQCNAIPEGRVLDLDKDHMNNCEEKVLGSVYTSFDSNGDWIPDLLALRYQLAFLDGNQEINLDVDNDGVINYDEVKLFTPVNFDNSEVLGLKPYKYNLVKVGQNEKQECYRLEVSNIALSSARDRIRVYLIESASVIEDKRWIRTAERQISGNDLTIRFEDQDFQ